MENKTKELQAIVPATFGAVLLVPKLFRLLMRLFRDKRVPKYLKFLTAGAVAYVALPLDFLPDFVPTAGLLDDMLVILLILIQYVKVCPAEVFAEHWEEEMGADFDVEAQVKASINELQPLVGSRFTMLREWALSAAGKLGQAERFETAERAEEMEEADTQ